MAVSLLHTQRRRRRCDGEKEQRSESTRKRARSAGGEQAAEGREDVCIRLTRARFSSTAKMENEEKRQGVAHSGKERE